MPNPNPRQTEEFKRKRFQAVAPLPDEKLASKPVSVKVGESVQAAIADLPQKERITWLRRVITDAARAELMGE